MEIIDIIKDSFMFPANNLTALAIYIAITFVIGILAGIGAAVGALAANSGAFVIVAAIMFILALVVSFVLAGYEVDIVKTGIDLEDVAPSIDFKNDLVRGIKAIIVAIVYFIIPAIITLIVAFLTNVPGNVVNVMGYVNQTVANSNGTVVANTVLEMVPKDVMGNLVGSLSITLLIALVLFIIFSFFHYMANARLANTDSLGEALNIPEAFKDLSRIGYGKVIATVILMVIIVSAITGILSFVYGKIPMLSILNIIVSPFLMFAMNRANGLLYSDIA